MFVFASSLSERDFWSKNVVLHFLSYFYLDVSPYNGKSTIGKVVFLGVNAHWKWADKLTTPISKPVALVKLDIAIAWAKNNSRSMLYRTTQKNCARSKTLISQRLLNLMIWKLYQNKAWASNTTIVKISCKSIVRLALGNMHDFPEPYVFPKLMYNGI